MITSPPRGPSWYRVDVTRSTVLRLAGAERSPGKRRQVHVAGERKRKREGEGEGGSESEREKKRLEEEDLALSCLD